MDDKYYPGTTEYTNYGRHQVSYDDRDKEPRKLSDERCRKSDSINSASDFTGPKIE